MQQCFAPLRLGLDAEGPQTVSLFAACIEETFLVCSFMPLA